MIPKQSNSWSLRLDQTTQLSSTASLLERIREGDARAEGELIQIYLPILQRWARGRLPGYARSLAETADLVQNTLIKALERVDSFESKREGAFLAYLRTILVNAVRREIRRPSNRHPHEEVDEKNRVAEDTLWVDYETALKSLNPEAREAIILRLEFGLTYGEVAAAMRKPSANAARMYVTRALSSLAEALE